MYKKFLLFFIIMILGATSSANIDTNNKGISLSPKYDASGLWDIKNSGAPWSQCYNKKYSNTCKYFEEVLFDDYREGRELIIVQVEDKFFELFEQVEGTIDYNRYSYSFIDTVDSPDGYVITYAWTISFILINKTHFTGKINLEVSTNMAGLLCLAVLPIHGDR